jgi:hypothetical protein
VIECGRVYIGVRQAGIGGMAARVVCCCDEFRTFAHPPSRMLGVLEERGLRRTFAHHRLVWRIAGLERNLSRQVS